MLSGQCLIGRRRGVALCLGLADILGTGGLRSLGQRFGDRPEVRRWTGRGLFGRFLTARDSRARAMTLQTRRFVGPIRRLPSSGYDRRSDVQAKPPKEVSAGGWLGTPFRMTRACANEAGSYSGYGVVLPTRTRSGRWRLETRAASSVITRRANGRSLERARGVGDRRQRCRCTLAQRWHRFGPVGAPQPKKRRRAREGHAAESTTVRSRAVRRWAGRCYRSSPAH